MKTNWRLLLLIGSLPLGLMAQTVVTTVTYPSGQTPTVVGPSTITTSGTVIVGNGANATFWATQSISLTAGFKVESGGVFHGIVAPLLDTDGDGTDDFDDPFPNDYYN